MEELTEGVRNFMSQPSKIKVRNDGKEIRVQRKAADFLRQNRSEEFFIRHYGGSFLMKGEEITVRTDRKGAKVNERDPDLDAEFGKFKILHDWIWIIIFKSMKNTNYHRQSNKWKIIRTVYRSFPALLETWKVQKCSGWLRGKIFILIFFFFPCLNKLKS